MSEFSEFDLINRMYEEDIDFDRHFDETLIEKKRLPMKFKKGDYVYYVNFDGDTYPTRIIAVGRGLGRTNSVLIEIKTFKSNISRNRWVSKARVRLQEA